jgi:hypothetical protein
MRYLPLATIESCVAGAFTAAKIVTVNYCMQVRQVALGFFRNDGSMSVFSDTKDDSV